MAFANHSPAPLVFKPGEGWVHQAAADRQDWPQWRGPKRDGHAASETISTLPKELKPLWKLPVGPGFASPIVVGGGASRFPWAVIYVDEQHESEVVHCLAAPNGKEVWQAVLAPSFGDEWGSGPRSTPFEDGGRIYAQSMNGEFACLKM